MEEESKETKIEEQHELEVEEEALSDREDDNNDKEVIMEGQEDDDADDGREMDEDVQLQPVPDTTEGGGDKISDKENNNSTIKKNTSSHSLGGGRRNQGSNTTFTITTESGPGGRSSKMSLSIEENNEDVKMAVDEDPDESLYQTVLMGNDSLTGCAILDPNSKFGNLSIINPPMAVGVPSTGQVSMQAHAGSMEELETHRDRGDRNVRQRERERLPVSQPMNLWPSSTESKTFDLYDDDYSGDDGDVGDGIYPYPALTDTEEGHEIGLKDFEEQERAICGSLGFDVDKKHWDEYDEEELRVLKPPSKREREVKVSFAMKPPTPFGQRPRPQQASKAVQVQFNESSIIYRNAGPAVAAPIKFRIQKQLKQAPPVESVPPTRPAPPIPDKFVEKAVLSSTLPMASRKTATTELRFYSAQRQTSRGGGDTKGKMNTSHKLQRLGDSKLFMEDHIYEEEEEQKPDAEVYEIPKVPKPLRREKLEAFSAFTYTPDRKEMAAHQSAFFSGLKKNQGGGEGTSLNFSCGGHGYDGPHTCYICAPVPEGSVALLMDKIGLTATEARRAGYLFMKYLKDQRHTESVQEVMRYLQPDAMEGRRHGFSSKLNTKM